jgi:hypothetical protein
MATARRSGWRAFVGRFVVAHFACYPMMFWASVAGMSLGIIASTRRLEAVADQIEPANAFQRWLVMRVGLDAAEAASFQIVMTPVAVVLAIIFVVSHVASIPWGLAARRAALYPALGKADVERARRIWLRTSLGVTGLVVLAGAVGWVVILLA